MPVVPELRPQDVGTPLPINAAVPVETYTYDYVVVGGKSSSAINHFRSDILMCVH